MNSNTKLTKESFEALLLWLSSDREEAGEKYEQIRKKLLRFFEFKGSHNPEELIDETINRVISKLSELNLSKGNQPITIFYGFASNVYFENLKKERKEIALDEAGDLKTETEVDTDSYLEALEKCLESLNDFERNLVIEYYSGNKSQKFEIRRRLAEKLNLSMGAMHIKVHRLRKNLHKCIVRRLKNNP